MQAIGTNISPFNNLFFFFFLIFFFFEFEVLSTKARELFIYLFSFGGPNQNAYSLLISDLVRHWHLLQYGPGTSALLRN